MGRSRLTEKQRELRKLTREVRSRTRDINVIIDKHNNYTIDDVDNWFDSYPIETLQESLLEEHGKKRLKFSLQDFLEKRRLRRLHQTKMDELEAVACKQSIAEIDVLLEGIDEIQSNSS